MHACQAKIWFNGAARQSCCSHESYHFHILEILGNPTQLLGRKGVIPQRRTENEHSLLSIFSCSCDLQKRVQKVVYLTSSRASDTSLLVYVIHNMIISKDMSDWTGDARVHVHVKAHQVYIIGAFYFTSLGKVGGRLSHSVFGCSSLHVVVTYLYAQNQRSQCVLSAHIVLHTNGGDNLVVSDPQIQIGKSDTHTV